MDETTTTMYRVECEDGQVRHAGLLTLQQAWQFAENGHACTNRHHFEAIEIGEEE